MFILVVYPSVWCQNPPYLGYMILLHFREEPIQRQRRKITRHFVPRMYLFFRSMWESIASKYQCQSASDYSLILYSICALLCSFFHSLSAFDFCSFLSDTVSFSPFNEKNEMKSECGNNNNKKTNGIIFNVIFSFRQQFTCLHQQKFNEENETQTHKKENGIKIETIQSGLYVGWNGYYVGLSHVIFARSLLHITCMLSKHRFFLFSFANYTEKRNWHIDIWKNAILGMGIKHRQRRSVE